MEVNRSAGKLRFTISVLEIERNAEDKYLPRAFTMNFFDAASGEFKMSLGYWNSGSASASSTCRARSWKSAPIRAAPRRGRSNSPTASSREEVKKRGRNGRGSDARAMQ